MTTETKVAHTPGPWRVNKYGGIGAGDSGLMPLIVASSWPAGYYAFEGLSDVPRDEMEANARLIAAAPELLAALKAAEWPWTGASGASVQRCSCCGRDRIDGHNAVCRVGLAIAKAEGR